MMYQQVEVRPALGLSCLKGPLNSVDPIEVVDPELELGIDLDHRLFKSPSDLV